MGAYTKYGTCPLCAGKTVKHDADCMWLCNEPDCDWDEEWEESDEDNHDDEMEDQDEE